MSTGNMTNNADQTAKLLASNKALIQEATNFLEVQGKRYSLSEWITLKEYAKRHRLHSISVLSNWINLGIITNNDILIIEELSALKLIRDKIYK